MKMRFFGLMAGLLLCLSCNSQSKVPVISPEDFAKAIASAATSSNGNRPGEKTVSLRRLRAQAVSIPYTER